MHLLTFPTPVLRGVLRALESRHSVVVSVGRRSSGDACEWLVRAMVDASEGPAHAPARARFLQVATRQAAVPGPIPSLVAAGVIGEFVLPLGPPAGHLSGRIWIGGHSEPLDVVRLVGPGMHRMALSDVDVAEDLAPLRFQTPAETLWSRTISALGNVGTWRRFTGLHVAIVGCGRTGSLVATNLRRIGVRELTLVDPDRVEHHNCGEMDLIDQTDVDQLKVDALARRLDSIVMPVASRIGALAEPVDQPDALAALRRADLIVCCADSDAARLTTAIMATIYHKVLLDIGTGIRERRRATKSGNDELARHEVAVAQRVPTPVMGADVRLVLPGDGCLLCRGSLTDHRQALENLLSHRTAVPTRDRPHERRIGSLRSLNQLAVAIGMRMLEDLVAERLSATIWARIMGEEGGRLSLSYPDSASSPECELCARAGLGDDAF